MILPSSMHGLRILVETAAEKAGIRIDVHTQADSFHVTKELVESGLGYTVLPLCAFKREAAAGRLTFARFRKPQVTRQLFLALKPAAEYPRATLQVEGLVRQEVAELVESGVPADRALDIVRDAMAERRGQRMLDASARVRMLIRQGVPPRDAVERVRAMLRDAGGVGPALPPGSEPVRPRR